MEENYWDLPQEYFNVPDEHIEDNELPSEDQEETLIEEEEEEPQVEEEDDSYLFEEDDEDINELVYGGYKKPEYTSSTSTGGFFGGIFHNEGARTGQPTNLHSSAVGRGQMIKGTRLAMYKKLGISDTDRAERLFRSDPNFEMQVMEAYRDELDTRIPQSIQGSQREYMLAKGWYTGNPFYEDNKVPGKSAGNTLTAGEYARKALGYKQLGGLVEGIASGGVSALMGIGTDIIDKSLDRIFNPGGADLSIAQQALNGLAEQGAMQDKALAQAKKEQGYYQVGGSTFADLRATKPFMGYGTGNIDSVKNQQFMNLGFKNGIPAPLEQKMNQPITSTNSPIDLGGVGKGLANKVLQSSNWLDNALGGNLGLGVQVTSALLSAQDQSEQRKRQWEQLDKAAYQKPNLTKNISGEGLPAYGQQGRRIGRYWIEY